MMHTGYRVEPSTHDQACRILEALCEGVVLAMMEEFDSSPEGEYPCCIKCGKFRTVSDPFIPSHEDSIGESAESGKHIPGLHRHALADVPTTTGRQRPRPGIAIMLRSATEILESRRGSTVELACYQCAMKRRGGADPGAKVIICCVEPGTFRGAVLMSHLHSKPEKRGKIDDPVVDARPIGACGCIG